MEVVVEVTRLRQLTHWVSAGLSRSLSVLPLRINHVCVFLQRAALDHRLINPFFSSEILGIPDENNAADDCWTNLCAGASSGQSRTSNNSPSPARVAEPANKPQTFKRKRILGDAAASPVAVQKQRLSHTQTNNQLPLLSDRETLQDGRLDGRLKCGCVSTCQTVIPMIPMEYKLLEDHAALEILAAAYQLGGADALTSFCRPHLRRLVATIGLKNSFLGSSSESLAGRARACFKHRRRLSEIRYRHGDWFVKECQNNDIRSRLGGAKYEAVPMPSFDIDPEKIFKRFASRQHWEDFQRDGTVNVRGVFSYLWDAADISDMIDAEFDLYRHHYHAAGNHGKRLGWARNMWYSLIQQIVRQDPMYYCLMAASRPDRNWKLISYPYYTKDTETEESTGFTHLDLNLRSFIKTGKGGNIVQGALALTDETDRNCTVLVPGFQEYIREWWNDLTARGMGDTAGSTTNLKGLYTPADRKKYGEFQPVPCKRGDIRITLPQIPHGSSAKSDGRRKVVFPWFTGIGEDHETLDNPESEKWSQLAAFHRDLVPCTLSPSGRHTSAYQCGSHFQAAVLLPATSHVGDALVGRRRWDSLQVLYEANILFGDDDVAARELVVRIRQRLLEAYRAAWKELIIVEKQLYGNRSFFHIVENDIPAPPPDGLRDSDSGSEVNDGTESGAEGVR
jgi:hypothetical protein